MDGIAWGSPFPQQDAEKGSHGSLWQIWQERGTSVPAPDVLPRLLTPPDPRIRTWGHSAVYLMRLSTAQTNPGEQASGQDSGCEGDADRLEWFLPDGVLHVIDCVLGGMACLPDGLVCRSNAIFHCVGDDSLHFGYRPISILKRWGFF